MFLAAAVQMRCTDDIDANLERLESHCLRAASYGATLIATPENTAFLGPQFHKVELAQSIDGPLAIRFSQLARRCNAHLLVGSFAEVHTNESGMVDTQKCHNTSLLFSPQGNLLAHYRKMHLFDVDIPGGLTIAESDSIVPGTDVVVASTELGRIGMSICYDLRFPELYRAHVDSGAQIIAIPSAFTLTTGKDHWHALLRARAIETQCWVIAPAQWGTHDKDGKRKSYGHSMIIDPWGTIVAEIGEGEGICLAEIDIERINRVRQSIPVNQHRRL